VRKYEVDQWVLFCLFPDPKYPSLSSERKKSVILEVLPKEDRNDYRIFIDGTGKIKNVKEHQLFPDPASTYYKDGT
jgi:hypothetical protein|tara:strand:- start:242 stop:469 length:228 start_codon:yes stop_codon:yes gene_type:complete